MSGKEPVQGLQGLFAVQTLQPAEGAEGLASETNVRQLCAGAHPNSEMTQLTDKQRRVFEFIQGRLLAGVSAPSIRDISRRFGWSGCAATVCHVTALIRKGWLVREPRKGRALRLTSPKPTRTNFALRVSGDSMIDQHILHGDIAIFQANARPRPGQIVAALIDGKTTFKRWVKKNRQTMVIQGVLRTIVRRTIELDRLTRESRRLQARLPAACR